MRIRVIILPAVILFIFFAGCRNETERITARVKEKIASMQNMDKEELLEECIDLCGEFTNTGDRCRTECQTANRNQLFEYIKIMMIAQEKRLSELPGY